MDYQVNILFYILILFISISDTNSIENRYPVKNYQLILPSSDEYIDNVSNETNQQQQQMIFTEDNQCPRQCLEQLSNAKHIIVNWIVDRNSLDYNSQIKSINLLEAGYSNNTNENREHLNCKIFLKIGCKYSTPVEKITDKFITLTERNDVIGFSETLFEIDDSIEKFYIKIYGDISRLLLEIPIESLSQRLNEDVEEKKLILELLMHKNNKNELLVITKNPPSGNWKLKLDGLFKYSNYNLSVLILPKVTIFKRTLENLNNSPEEQTSLDEDSIDNFAKNEKTNTLNHLNIININPTELENKNSEKYIENNENYDVYQTSNGLSTELKAITIDITPETDLIVKPGSTHRLIFSIKNNLKVLLLYTVIARSTNFEILQPKVPINVWLEPEKTFQFSVLIYIPNIQDYTTDTITLYVDRSNNVKAFKKSAYIFVQSSNQEIRDFNKPTFYYSFNDNCAGKLSQDKCGASRWSVDMTVTDSESGLKRVTSQPSGIREKSDFIAGTKTPVYFIYSSTCCYTTVQITGIDVNGNTFCEIIDVTVWNNLSQGEIAAIVVGVLFLLFIIILLILLCIYCVKRRKSSDLTFTQRYGSRSSPGIERTNF